MKRWRFLYSTIGIVFLMFGCVSRTQQNSALPNSSVSQRIEITARLADSLWAKRTDPDNALDALYAYEFLATQDSTALPAWSKLVHAYYYYGQYVAQQDSTLRDSMFAVGYGAAQKILAQSKPYQSVLISSGDPQLAVKSLDASYNQVLYWGAACLAQWTATKGEIVQRGQRPWILAVLNHVYGLDSTFNFGGYDRFLGALLCIDPLAGENALQEAYQYFEKAITLAPDYLGTYTLMARYYARQIKDEQLFHQLLTKVVTAKVDVSSPFGPENYYEKQRAENLLLLAQQEGWFTP